MSDDRTNFEISELFIRAALASGIPANPDCNDGEQRGVGYYQTMTRRGFRSSTATGHLARAARRANLSVVTRSMCERVVLERGRAVGVDVRGPTGVRRLQCAREVLLSGGSIGSPHLLMLSGIGDPDHLRANRVTPLVDLPNVGRNLQDHLRIHNSFKTRVRTLNDALNSPFGRLRMGLQYVLTRRGPLTMGAAPVFCFTASDPASARPDLQFHVLPWSSDAPSTGVMDPFSGFTASLCPLRPTSRGQIRLASNDASDPPRITANYLTTKKDCADAVAALRLSREICSHAPACGCYRPRARAGPSREHRRGTTQLR